MLLYIPPQKKLKSLVQPIGVLHEKEEGWIVQISNLNVCVEPGVDVAVYALVIRVVQGK
jgi:hypothetical protein